MGEPARGAYSVRETSIRLGKTRVQVQRWCMTGKIPAYKVGSVWMVPAAWLDVQFPAYDDLDEGTQRGEPVPPEPGQPLGGDGADAERASAVTVGRVQEAGSRRAPRTHQAAGRGDPGGPFSATAWSLPGEVAR